MESLLSRVEALEATLRQRDDDMTSLAQVVTAMTARLSGLEQTCKAQAERIDALETAARSPRPSPPSRYRPPFRVHFNNGSTTPRSILKSPSASPPSGSGSRAAGTPPTTRPHPGTRKALPPSPPPPPPKRGESPSPVPGGGGAARSPSPAPSKTNVRKKRGRVLLTAKVVNGLPLTMEPRERVGGTLSTREVALEPWSPIKQDKATPRGRSKAKIAEDLAKSREFAKRTQEDLLKRKALAVIDKLVQHNGLEQIRKLTMGDPLHVIRNEEAEIRALISDMKRATAVKMEMLGGLGPGDLDAALERARDVVTRRPSWANEPFFHVMVPRGSKEPTFLVPQAGDEARFKTGVFVDAHACRHDVVLWGGTFCRVAAQQRDARTLSWLMRNGANPYLDDTSDTDFFVQLVEGATADSELREVAAQLREEAEAMLEAELEAEEADKADAQHGIMV